MTRVLDVPWCDRANGEAPSIADFGSLGWLRYWPAWEPAMPARDVMAAIAKEVQLKQETIQMFGKPILEPRLSAWIGAPEAQYVYSGRLHTPRPWTPTLRGIRERLLETLQERFNAVLVNYYRDGNDALGYHADDEPELGPSPTIASISLGAERRFLMRTQDEPRRTYSLRLASGSLLVMGGAFQHHFKHALPRSRDATQMSLLDAPVVRMNLTYRLLIGEG